MRRLCVMGCGKRSKGRGLCHGCYTRMQRYNRLDQFPITRVTRPATELLEDLDDLVETGEHPARWHIRLGVSAAALERALYRAGLDDRARQVSKVRRDERRGDESRGALA